jgi:Cu2+-exporting ATPase
MVGNGLGAKNGILFKTSEALESAGKVQIIALDKTGTITSGKPKVTDIIPGSGYTEERLLELAYALEKKSEHPLAGAVVEAARVRGLQAQEVSDFRALPGNGLTATLNGKVLQGGSETYILGTLDPAAVGGTLREQSGRLAVQGKTPLFFAEDGKPAGIIAVADVIKEDSAEAVHQLGDAAQAGYRALPGNGGDELQGFFVGHSCLQRIRVGEAVCGGRGQWG